ncbi:Hypothetical predicted protein [Cloeon dipterum]|uniref:Uncharacterized protein n=1 Tax=Cloeon dipterum TaxID=197152 RepID=A0A8S1BKA4_9INSE|nr:Hypothetical predicted protein [Cloeon dipterum]
MIIFNSPRTVKCGYEIENWSCILKGNNECCQMNSPLTEKCLGSPPLIIIRLITFRSHDNKLLLRGE